MGLAGHNFRVSQMQKREKYNFMAVPLLSTASAPLISAFSFYLPYAIRNATILKKISDLSLSQRGNGLLARDTGVCVGASVDTCHYHSWPRLLPLLDPNEDFSNEKE